MAQQNSKPLSSRAIEVMKPGDKVKSDNGENRGLRVIRGNAGTKTFFYRYKSPESGGLVQMKLGHYPTLSLAQARARLHELKLQRNAGVCPASEQKRRIELERRELARKKRTESFLVKDMIELYLTQHIEDRKFKGKVVPGARKSKGQDEVRRTLYGDAVRVLGKKPAPGYQQV